MFRIAWRSLIAHKLRTLLTTLAILLGVAMISGTFVLTDQINRGFDEIFSDAYKGTDVTITRKAEFTSQFGGASEALPESLADEIGGVDGVKAAYGYVSGMGAVAVDGEVVADGRFADALLQCRAERHQQHRLRRGSASGDGRARSA